MADTPLVAGSAALAAAKRAADLVNSLADDATTIDDITSALEAHGEPGPVDLTTADLEQMRVSGDRLRLIFGADSDQHAAESLNALLADHAQAPRLTCHDHTPWHLHVDATDDAPWAQWLLVSSALALATLQADRQHRPGGICASHRCERVFIDTGKGNSRRYCSTRCAGRERVAAHRNAARDH